MIKLHDKEVRVEHYPDGTQKIILDRYPIYNMTITWKFEKEEELSTLIYLVSHIKNRPYTQKVVLNLPYFPNARMDRIHNCCEVFTLKSFADVINWLNFDAVKVLDIHSNVGAALLNNAIICSPEGYITKAIKRIQEEFENEDDKQNIILYFPDAGAAKRYSDLLSGMPYCYGEKKRDWETGKITGLDIRTNGIDLTGKDVFMADDIITYGGSMYYSALELQKYKVNKIYAYATHTENSVLDKDKGTLIKLLEDGTVERLFTTDSLFNKTHEKIEVMKVL